SFVGVLRDAADEATQGEIDGFFLRAEAVEAHRVTDELVVDVDVRPAHAGSIHMTYTCRCTASPRGSRPRAPRARARTPGRSGTAPRHRGAPRPRGSPGRRTRASGAPAARGRGSRPRQRTRRIAAAVGPSPT